MLAVGMSKDKDKDKGKGKGKGKCKCKCKCMGMGMGMGKWIGVFGAASSGLCGSEPPLANGQSGSGLVATAAFDRRAVSRKKQAEGGLYNPDQCHRPQKFHVFTP